MAEVDFSILEGKTLVSIEGASIGSDAINFTCSDGAEYRMIHLQDCCESVAVEEIHGDVDDILNSPIVFAYQSTNSDDKPNQYEDSFTWTFYRIQTAKGALVIRWLGTSNGYYSESVDFEQV